MKLMEEMRALGEEMGKNEVSAEDVKEADETARKHGGPAALRVYEQGFRDGARERNSSNHRHAGWKNHTLDKTLKTLKRLAQSIRSSTDDIPNIEVDIEPLK